jgi:hypothetical protein
MKPAKNWIFLTETDYEAQISLHEFESAMKMYACFHEHTVISDTTALMNWKLFTVVSEEKGWKDAGLVVAMRHTVDGLLDLHRHFLERKTLNIPADPSMAKFFDKAHCERFGGWPN